MKSQEGGIGFWWSLQHPNNNYLLYVSVYIGKRCLVYKSFSLGSLNACYDKISITEFQNSNSKFNPNSINLKYSVYIGVRGALLLLSLLLSELPSARLVCYYNLTKFQSQNSALASVINNVSNLICTQIIISSWRV